jgi:hypothetical protein
MRQETEVVLEENQEPEAEQDAKRYFVAKGVYRMKNW